MASTRWQNYDAFVLRRLLLAIVVGVSLVALPTSTHADDPALRNSLRTIGILQDAYDASAGISTRPLPELGAVGFDGWLYYPESVSAFDGPSGDEQRFIRSRLWRLNLESGQTQLLNDSDTTSSGAAVSAPLATGSFDWGFSDWTLSSKFVPVAGGILANSSIGQVLLVKPREGHVAVLPLPSGRLVGSDWNGGAWIRLQVGCDPSCSGTQLIRVDGFGNQISGEVIDSRDWESVNFEKVVGVTDAGDPVVIDFVSDTRRGVARLNRTSGLVETVALLPDVANLNGRLINSDRVALNAENESLLVVEMDSGSVIRVADLPGVAATPPPSPGRALTAALGNFSIVGGSPAGGIIVVDAYVGVGGFGQAEQFVPTRFALHEIGGRVAAAGRVCFAVPGSPGDIALMNLTPVLAEATGNGQLVSSDVGQPPVASNVNYQPGSVDPNVAIAPIGNDGKVCYVNADLTNVHLIADHLGTIDSSVFTPATPSGAPDRKIDTRSAR